MKILCACAHSAGRNWAWCLGAGALDVGVQKKKQKNVNKSVKSRPTCDLGGSGDQFREKKGLQDSREAAQRGPKEPQESPRRRRGEKSGTLWVVLGRLLGPKALQRW